MENQRNYDVFTLGPLQDVNTDPYMVATLLQRVDALGPNPSVAAVNAVAAQFPQAVMALNALVNNPANRRSLEALLRNASANGRCAALLQLLSATQAVTGLLTITVGATVAMPPWTPTGDWSYEATTNPTVPGCHFLSSENSEGRLAIADTGVIAGKNVSPPNFGDVLTYGFDGNPHTIRIAQDGTTLSAYVDGELRGQAVGFTLDVGTVDRMFVKWGGATSVPPFYGTVEDITLSADGLSDRIYPLELVGEDIQPDSALPDEPLTLAGVDHAVDWVLDNPVVEPEEPEEPEQPASPTTNDSVSLLMNEALIIDVADTILANDDGWGAGALTASIATQPSNGVLVDNADGTWTYTPDADYSGADSATVSVTDGTNTETTALNLTVIDASTLPVFTAATFQTPDTLTDGETVTLQGANLGTMAQAQPKLFDLVGTAYVHGTGWVDTSADAATPWVPLGDWRDDYIDTAAGEYPIPRPSVLYAKSCLTDTGMNPVVTPPSATPLRHSGNHLSAQNTYRIDGTKSFLGWPYALGTAGDAYDTPLGDTIIVAMMMKQNVPQMNYFRLHVDGGDDPQSFNGATDGYWNFGTSTEVTIEDTLTGSTCVGLVIGFDASMDELHVAVYNAAEMGPITKSSYTPELEYGTITGGGFTCTYDMINSPGADKIMRVWNEPSGSNYRMSWTETVGLYGNKPNDGFMTPDVPLAPDQRWSLIVFQGDDAAQKMRGWSNGRQLYDMNTGKAYTDRRSPNIGIIGIDGASGVGDQLFSRKLIGEIYAGHDPQFMFLANHGLASQATEFEPQMMDSFDNAGNLSFKARLGNIPEEDAYLFFINESGLVNQLGFHLATQTVYDPNASADRYYLSLDGVNQHARFPSDPGALSLPDGVAWEYGIMLKAPANHVGANVVQGGSLHVYLGFNADNTVTVRTNADRTSASAFTSRWRSGEWFLIYLVADPTNDKIYVSVKFGDGTVETVEVDAPNSGALIDRIGRAGSSYGTWDGIANLQTSLGHDLRFDENTGVAGGEVIDYGEGRNMVRLNTVVDSAKFGPVPAIEF